MSRTVPWLLVLSAVVAGLAGCSSDDGPLVAGSGDLGHVHDLVLEADGTLLAATHSGLYRIEGPDRAVLAGPEQHDLMSMVGLDNGDLLASGHPDLRLDRFRVDGLPPLLGLVRSSDGGVSWQVQDLLGEADFHAMVSAGGGLYVAASTEQIALLHPSGDWQMFGSVVAADLAVSPDEPRRFAATDFDGVLRVSSDAFTWLSSDDVPALVQIEWPEPDRLLGIDLSGEIWVTSAPEGPWIKVAVGPTRPETFLVDATGSWWVAARGGVISRSDNDGVAWIDVYTPPTAN